MEEKGKKMEEQLEQVKGMLKPVINEEKRIQALLAEEQ